MAALSLALAAPLTKLVRKLAIAFLAPIRVVVVQFAQLVVAPLLVVMVLVHAHVATSAMQLAACTARLVGFVVRSKTPVATTAGRAVALQVLQTAPVAAIAALAALMG